MRAICLILMMITVWSCKDRGISSLFVGTTKPQLPAKPKKQFTTVKASKTDTLYPIQYDNLYGYINQDGKVVIAPMYHSAGDFSEGLAAVREHGLYGYIDIYGNYVIQPQYHFAYEFHEGFARIQNDSVTYFIDRTGRNLLPFKLKDADDFKDGLARIATYTRKVGLVDATGRLVADTIYSSIGDFHSGLAIVQPFKAKKNNSEHVTGAINRKGRLVIPYSKYLLDNDFKDGNAIVRIDGEHREWNYFQGIIDTTGRLIVKIRTAQYYITDLSQGLLTASIDNNYGSKTHSGYLNLKGEIVLKNNEWEEVQPFTEGRAFAGDYREWRLIDLQGKYITEEEFVHVHDSGFVNGQAIVGQNEDVWGVIDTTGKYVFDKKYQQLAYADDEKSMYLCKDWDKWGLLDRNGNIIAEPIYTRVGRSFNKGLLYVERDSLYGYINKRGKLVWSEIDLYRNDSIRKLYAPDTLNIDYMEFTNYSVYSQADYKKGSGGWAQSRNFEKPVRKDMVPKQNKQYIEITDTPTTYYGYAGMMIRVVNNTTDTAIFEAQDSDLYLMLQAQDESGVWRDIQFTIRSWCGNSYHEVILPPKYYWQLTMPIYNGSTKTKLRYVLNTNSPKGNLQFISNEVDGFVNPAQFWRTNRYRPSNIMDPYAH